MTLDTEGKCANSEVQRKAAVRGWAMGRSRSESFLPLSSSLQNLLTLDVQVITDVISPGRGGYTGLVMMGIENVNLS